MSNPDELRLLDHEPARFAFFAWNNITVMVWLALPDATDVARLIKMGEGRAAEQSAKLSDVHLVPHKVGLPDAEARDALLRASRSGARHLAAVGVWLAGAGFWASAVRGFVTSLNVVLKAPFELRMFGDQKDLAEWLAPLHTERTGIEITVPRLRDVMQAAQHRAEQLPPLS